MPNAAAKRIREAQEGLSPAANTKGRRGANQHTARRAELSAFRQAERWQENERFSAAALMRRLADIQEGKAEVSPTQVKALELMLSRVSPSLSAVEQSTVDPALALTEAQIEEQLRQLIAAHPELVQRLLGEAARVAPMPPVEVKPV